jgi:hypothetical protein
MVAERQPVHDSCENDYSRMSNKPGTNALGLLIGFSGEILILRTGTRALGGH